LLRQCPQQLLPGQQLRRSLRPELRRPVRQRLRPELRRSLRQRLCGLCTRRELLLAVRHDLCL
jgi:hypothetical protein